MVSSSQILQHLIQAVGTTPLVEEPFHHLRFDDIFPTDVYREIVSHLPETHYYGELNHSDARLPNGRSARRKLELRPAHLRVLPPIQRKIWSAFAAAFNSAELENSYKQRFASALQLRFQKSPDDLKFHSAAMLLRDIGGYKISVHCDSFRKAITTQYYLPRNDSQHHLGTIFHQKQTDGSFVEAKSLQFAPNSGYAFPVVTNSWHSVRQMTERDGARDSLMLIYYVDQGPVGEAINAAKRFAQDMRCRLGRHYR